MRTGESPGLSLGVVLLSTSSEEDFSLIEQCLFVSIVVGRRDASLGPNIGLAIGILSVVSGETF